MLSKRKSTTSGKIIVAFHIPGAIWAERINLVGDFNDWHRESLPFLRDRQGDWVIELELEAGREYRFRYLFDGREWRDEFQADKFIRNEYGSYDSLVIVELEDNAAEERK